MTVNIKYFGMIAEKVGVTSESVEIQIDKKINLRNFIESKYPSIKNMNYKIAVNQQIGDFISEESNGYEIALLPPFAGG
jgi:molybdopterin synthase sulfur carrier subunit